MKATFANSFLRADHGIVFEDVEGEVDLWHGFLVGHSALQGMGTAAVHDG